MEVVLNLMLGYHPHDVCAQDKYNEPLLIILELLPLSERISSGSEYSVMGMP